MGAVSSCVIEVRVEETATEIVRRIQIARWFKACLWGILPAWIVAGVLISYLVKNHAGMRGIGIGSIGIVAAILIGLGLVILLAFIGSKNTCRILIDPKTLQIQNGYLLFSIPRAEILGLSLTTHSRRRLDIDPSQPPCRLFTMVQPVSVDIDTADGRMQFFKSHTPADVPYLAESICTFLGVEHSSDAERNPLAVNAATMTRGGVMGLRIFYAAVAIFCVGFLYSEIVPAFLSRGWPVTGGTMTKSHWEKSIDEEKHTTYSAEAEYRYGVGFDTHRNDCIGYGYDYGSDAVRDVLQSHPAGSHISVYYSPSNPNRATLLTGPGTIDWLLGGMIMFFLPLTSYAYFIKRPSLEQNVLALKYRVKPVDPKRKLSINDADGMESLRWKVSQDLFERRHRELRRKYLFAGVRTIVLVLLVFFGTRACLETRLPDLFGQSKLTFCFVSLAFIAGFVVAAAGFSRGKPAEFRLTPDGVYISSREHPLLRYKYIHSFTVDRDRLPPHSAKLVLHLRNGIRRIIPLPGEMESRVLAEISNHFPMQEPLPRYSGLRRKDWWVGLGFALTASVGTGFILWRYHDYIHHHDLGIYFPGLIVVGPGTLLSAILYGRRASNQIFSFAFMINLFCLLIAMLMVVILTVSL